ncbi:TonB-dependent receptor plug domain-containing protein [soil metagenome]
MLTEIKTLRCIWMLLLLLAIGTAAEAQRGQLRGEVRDVETGAALDGALVRLVGTELRVTTDPLGKFYLTVPVGGRMEVEVSRIGYRPQRQSFATGVRDVVNIGFALEAAPILIPELSVVGRTYRELARIPGSAEVVSAQRLRESNPFSGNEVLRTVAGLHVQEEEGAGLRVNIGIRGLDPDRSRTVLMLEDGVPVSLNPYGEPEMYYTPAIDRMERVEVVKGSGSILFGPQTIGGVVNYVTPSAPLTPGGSLDLQGGSGGFFRALGGYGGTWDNVGLITSVLHRRADDIRGLHYSITDVTGKAGFSFGSSARAGLKLSIYDEESNSTYIGLTEAMYVADPNQHPAADDRLNVRRYQLTASHEVDVGAALLRTTAYGYTTTRDWARQDYEYIDGGSTIRLRPSSGQRNRSFEVAGIEPRLQWGHHLLGAAGELDAGVRVHFERAYDEYVVGSTATSRSGNVRDYEVRSGRALSGFLQNRFFLLGETLQVIPGVRVESFSYDRNILRTRVRRVDPLTGVVSRLPEDVDIRSGDSLSELIPGIGATWNPTERFTVFTGLHRGFAPPRVKDALIYDDRAVAPQERVGDIVSLQLDAERSWNLELGSRATPATGVQMEATGFVLDFSNQIIAPSLSAGSVAQAALANQGQTRHVGLESSLGLDWGAMLRLPVSVSTELKHTYVRSHFTDDRRMLDAVGDTVNVRGNSLPYAPEHRWFTAIGVQHRSGVRFHLDGSHVTSQFSDNFQTVEASANGRRGLIPAYSIWNATTSYLLPISGVTLTASVKNLMDSTYIASRRPEGIKPGLPRMIQIGARVGL